MEELPVLFEQSPGLQQINLEFSEIESLEPLLPLLSKFTELKELLLFGNRLESLPSDLSCLKNLVKLDISNNLIDNVQVILSSLVTLPSLVDLHYSVQNEDEERLIFSTLKTLEFLNGNPIPRNLESAHSQSRSSLSSGNLEDIEEAHEKCETTYPEKNNDTAQEYHEVRNTSELTEVEKTYLACEHSGYFGEDAYMSQDFVEKVATLYDEIRALWHSADISKDKKLAEDFDEGIKSIVVDLSGVIRSDYSEISKKLHTIKSKYELALICVHKLIDFIMLKSPNAGQFFQQLNRILEDLFSELLTVSLEGFSTPVVTMNSIDCAPRSPRIETYDKFSAEKDQILKRFQEERNEFIAEIEALKEENQKYLETIVRHSKNVADQMECQSKSLEEVRKIGGSVMNLKPNGKILTLRQLKEIIEEIYLSKTKYDERCLMNKMPRETMEQHMYNYLNTKYGLKSLILEWASTIVASIKKHATKDNDVAVFGKILKNECDEEFRMVQLQVKETVQELLRMNLKNKNPMRNSSDIQDMINERISGYLYQEEWNFIILYMYNEEDSAYLTQEISKAIKRKQHLNVLTPPKGKLSREEVILLKEKEKLIKTRVLYKDFMKVLLDFQLQGHEKFLTHFTQLFRQFDLDSDGIINEEEFRELVQMMDLGFSEHDVIRLLQIIDPYDNQQITFSEAVTLFSTELIPLEGMAVMKKLSLANS